MKALEFWKTVANDRANLLERLIGLLEEHEIRYCVIGGQAVNAYVEPVVTLDLDIVVAIDQMDLVREVLSREFQWKEFPHSMNVTVPGSDVRVQIQRDPTLSDFLERAERKNVLGIMLPVAALPDLLKAKIEAAREPTRRGSKKAKDIADIQRLSETYPEIDSLIPLEIKGRFS
jgi:hypothetical protein